MSEPADLTEVREPSSGIARPRPRRGALLYAAGWLLIAIAAAAPGAAADEPAAAPPGTSRAAEGDGPAFTVDHFEVAYQEPHPDQPSIAGLLPIRVELHATESGWVAPRPGEASERVLITGAPEAAEQYHASAIGSIARALLHAVHERGLLGVYVQPSADDIEVKSERDLREPGNQRLRFVIWVGRIKDVRTIAVGERVRGAWKVDNPYHRGIRNYSPLQVAEAGYENTTDLLQQEKLEHYLYRLNRHPGRHVEAALTTSEGGEGISLDYRVHETRVWNAYAQASNTGTERTNLWQSRFGVIHRQLSNHDDILAIEYLNSGFNDVNGIKVSYEAPWFRQHRPLWMQSSGKEPKWLRWADRSQVPWWGLERLRWQLEGGWTRIDSGSAGTLPGSFLFVDRVLSSDWNAGGELAYNFFQHRNLFVDAVLGGHFRGVSVTREDFRPSSGGEAEMFTTEMGLRADRVNLYSAIHGRFSAEWTGPLGSVDQYRDDFDSNLGRSRADSRWWLLLFDFGLSYYLEPLLNRDAWRDPSSQGSSTLSHEVALGLRGQYAFDYRLIPQSSQVIGGQYSVRGFPQGVAVGDSVYIGSFEYRFHLPRALPIRRRPLDLPWIGDFRVAPQQVYGRPDWDLVLRGFVDAGSSIRNARALSVGTELDQTLVGAGVGLELTFRGRFRARVDWARGIYQNVECAPLDVATTSCLSARQGDIDPKGELYFLFSVMY